MCGWFDNADSVRAALCAGNDWVSAREAVGYWQEEEMRSPPVMKSLGLCAGLLYIHDW